MNEPECEYAKGVCICTRTCDCECPEPKSGVALVSHECPVHNQFPWPHPECPADVHYAALPD